MVATTSSTAEDLSLTQAGTGMMLFINPCTIHITKDKAEGTLIPVGSVDEISYGQDVHRKTHLAPSTKFGRNEYYDGT
jgi:hypothetical protein